MASFMSQCRSALKSLTVECAQESVQDFVEKRNVWLGFYQASRLYAPEDTARLLDWVQYYNKLIYKQKFLNYKVDVDFVLALNASTNYNIFEQKIWLNKFCKINSFYTNLLLSKIKDLYALWNTREKQRILLKEKINLYKNLNRFNYCVLPVESGDFKCDIDFSIFENKVKNNKKFLSSFKYTPSQVYPEDYVRPAPKEGPKININLRKRIRYLINLFRNTKSTLFNKITNIKQYIYNKYQNYKEEEMIPLIDKGNNNIEQAHFQMDAQGADNLESEPAGNVILTESKGDSNVKLQSPSMNWTNYTTSDVIGSYTEMTDRWLKFGKFDWKKNNGTNTILKQYELPKDVIVNSMYKMCDVPNTIPFRVHRYWSGDMEIKIQLNSNKFQIGQLQCSFWYLPNLDKNFLLRQNVYSCSQTNHVLINAGSSNEATLLIKYKYHMPMLNTRQRDDQNEYLNLGKLMIIVLNPLTVSTGGPDTAYGSVFCRFINSKFTGQIAGNIDEVATFQMDKIALGALNGALGAMCPNMDNIQDTRNSQYVVPIAAHSWSFGTGITEPLQALRLDPVGMTRHPDGAINETLIKNICSKYGLVKIVNWMQNHSAGTLLVSFDAAPLMDKLDYASTGGNSTLYTLPKYFIPPVGVVSSLYNYWRGNIKFRFDIVASQFHTGRLIVGYVPGVTRDTRNITVNTILSGPHVVFTLQEDEQFVYSIPYIADRPFWSKKYQGNYIPDQVSAPSRIYVFVLNPLVPMQSVSDKVYINIYMAGDENFEVAVPVQPALGCPWNDKVLYSADEVITAFQYPYYPGDWHSANNGKTLVARNGATSNNVSYFNNHFLKKNKYNNDTHNAIGYYYQIADSTSAPYYKDVNSVMKPCIFSCLFWADTDHTNAIMVFCADESKAKACALNYSGNQLERAYQNTLITPDTTSNTYCKDNPFWVAKYVSGIILPGTIDFEYVEHQGEREQDSNVLKAGTSLISTQNGRFLFGEDFGDLKDIMRRYQVYTSFHIVPKTQTQLGQAIVNIPLMPQGLDLNIGSTNNVFQIINRCRDGHIPIILSGYKFYRGGMRLRLIMPTTRDVVCWVQHRPDRKLNSRTPIMCTDVDTANCLANHTYASFVQDCGVNSILQIEVPYYRNNAYNLLQQPPLTTRDEMYSCSLGELVVGAMYAKPDTRAIENYTITIYYSVADDFHPSTFQGFPPMLLLDDIAEQSSAKFQGLFDSISDKFNRKVEDIKTDVKSEILTVVNDEIIKVTDIATDKLEEFRKMVNDTNPFECFNASLTRVIMSQIAHAFANFSVKTLAIALASIIVELGSLALDMTSKLTTYFIDLMAYIKKKFSIDRTAQEVSGNQLTPPDSASENNPDNVANFQGNMEQTTGEGAITGIITILWTIVTNAFSVVANCRSKNYFSTMFLKDISQNMRSANVVFIWVRNILSVFDAMKIKVMGIVSPKYKAIRLLEEAHASIKAWAEEVVYLDDPQLFDKEKYLQKYKARVNIAFNLGRVLYSDISKIDDIKITRVITELYKKIRDLREKMLEFGDDSFVRREPFVVWQCGEAGVGKSFATHDIIMDLFKSRRDVHNVPPIYNHNFASDFWDSCVGNPAMIVDDIFNVQEGELLIKQLQLLFAVVSPVVLTPNKARLEDKGKSYNPKIFWMNSNYDFPRLNNVHMPAIYRRRHVLVKTIKSKDKIPCCPHCSGGSIEDIDPKWLKDYHHIKFSVATDVIDPNTTWSEPMSYRDFSDFMIKKYNDVMNKNEEIYANHVKQIFELMDMDPHEEDADVSDHLVKKIKGFESKHRRYISELTNSSIYGGIKELFSSFKDCVVDTRMSFFLGICDMLAIKDRVAIKQVENTVYVSLKPEEPSTSQPSDGVVFQMNSNPHHAPEDAYKVINFNYFDFHKIIDKGDKRMDMDFMKIKSCLGVAALKELEGRYRMDSKFLRRSIWALKDDTHSFSNLNRFSLFIETLFYRYEERLTADNILCKIIEKCKMYIENKSNKKIKEIYDIYTDNTIPFDETLCKHFTTEIFDVTYDKKTKNFMADGKRYDCCCTTENVRGQVVGRLDCPWDSFFFKYIFLRDWFTYNQTDYLRLVSKLNNEDYPTYLQVGKPQYVIYTKNFSLYLQSLKNNVYKGVMKLCKIGNVIWDCIKYMGTIIEKFLPIIIPIGAIALMGVGGYIAECSEQRAQQDRAKYWSNMQGPTYGNVNPNINLNKNVPKAQPQSEIPQFDVTIQRIRKNMFRITALYDDKYVKCEGFVINGRRLLVLRHYLEEFAKLPPYTSYYGKYHLRSTNKSDHGIQFNIHDCNKVWYNVMNPDGNYASNFVILDLPIIFEECKSLIKFFSTESDHKKFRGQGVLIQNDGSVHHNLPVDRENVKPIIISEEEGVSRVVLQDYYSYKLQGRGMCGSILLGLHLERPILGVHVAGIEKGNVRGLSEIISYEMFVEVPLLNKNYTDFVLPTLNDVQFSKLDMDNILYPVGCVENKLAAHNLGTTSIIPSLIHNVFEVRTEPAPLSKNDKRLPKGSKPLEDGIANKFKPPIDFLNKDVEDAGNDLLDIYKVNVKPIRGRVGIISHQDAICGVKGLEGFEALEWTTSPGFPLRFDKDSSQCHGKKWLFKLQERDSDVPLLLGYHPKLQNQLMVESAMRSRGIKPFTVFIDCLKDSTIPSEKCKIPGKTRIFSISPVQFTIEFKRYFLDFMASFQNARLNAEHGIGIDVNSSEWTDLASKLLNKGTKLVCGDYKNYGPGLMLKCAYKAFDIILEWYKFHGDEENNHIRRIMMCEILNAWYMAENLIYQTPCGIPSGSPITTPLNSMVGSIYLRIAWKHTTNLGFREMRDNTYFCTYGDDVIISVSDQLIEKFNTVTISKFFQNYNITFTDADKSGNLVEYRDILTSTFLKCEFGKHPTRLGMFIAKLDKVSIEGCANWIHKRHNPRLATIENCEQVLELAHGHGKEYFNHVKDKLIKEMQKCNLVFRTSTWDDIDNRRYN